MRKVKYSIDEDMGIDYRDVGPWRSYNLSADGDTLEELLESVTISEIDQDGGELDCYSIENVSQDIEQRVIQMINNKINETTTGEK